MTTDICCSPGGLPPSGPGRASGRTRCAGIPRRAFQGDHYDIPQDLYDIAVAAGAQPVGGRELLSRLLAAGLRLKKTRPIPRSRGA